MQLLNYVATHPEAITRYHASEMNLHMQSDTSFILAPVAKIRAGGYNYLGEPLLDPKETPHKPPPLNVPIHVECTTMKNVLKNAMKAELEALFLNFQQGAALIIVR